MMNTTIIFCIADTQTLEQATQRNCECPIPRTVPGEAAWGFGHSLVEGVAAHGRQVRISRSLPMLRILLFNNKQRKNLQRT